MYNIFTCACWHTCLLDTKVKKVLKQVHVLDNLKLNNHAQIQEIRSGGGGEALTFFFCFGVTEISM